MMGFNVLIVFGLLLVCRSVSGIKCYECNSVAGDECHKLNSCAKITDKCDHCVTIQTNVNVTRGCATSALNILDGEFCTDGKLEDGSSIKQCYCNKGDLCNSNTLPNPLVPLFQCYTCSKNMDEKDHGGSCFSVDRNTTVKDNCGICTTTKTNGGVLRECIPVPVLVPNGEFCDETNSTEGAVKSVCFCSNQKLCNSKIVEVVGNGIDGLIQNYVILFGFATILTFLAIN